MSLIRFYKGEEKEEVVNRKLNGCRVGVGCLLLMLLLAGIGPHTALAAPLYYEAASAGSNSTDNLYAVNADGSYNPVITNIPSYISQMAFDPSGNLYALGWYPSNVLYKITPSGSVSTFATPPGNGADWGMACDTAGNVYVADNSANAGTIIKYSPNGAPSTFATGLGGGVELGSMVFDGSGNLFVSKAFTSGSPTQADIYRITPGGTVSTYATVACHEALGLAFDKAGNLYADGDYALDPWVIYKITSDGGVSTFATGLCEPEGLVIDPSGNLYCTNWPDNIDKITPDKSVSLFNSLPGPAGIAMAGDFVITPEPATLSLLALGGLALIRRRKKP